MILYIIPVLLAVFIVVYFRLYLFACPHNRLVILMYHQVEKESHEDLTVSVKNLEQQFSYLNRKKYIPHFFSELTISSKKNIIITFDDGYKNNLEYLPSLLEKYDLKATIFIPTGFIEKGYNNYSMMTFDEIRSLDKKYFEIALHSHAHENLKNISIDCIEKDLKKNMEILDAHNIKYSKVLAYPYGKYPQKKEDKLTFFSILKKIGIEFAVRIGNKVNYYPTQRPYELCRIDIKGKDSIIKFKLKLIFGRLKLF
ncbi:polysaccharide deacetylase family protein [Chryseobacterium culicis]|uniref:Polysaccharide deacetylase n=1 Tax=Chryseobacterium culicis TaxID=680127 RepID=A0A2S9D2P9_CHRCI|nr:polysaccharide deacetylase family protein [Chryseobacterium culicis]PRB87048.1 polysaccharide deacetylase [Chryseobacterium culicis]PRB92801.1 polysaccharide deacetylase [Chryseobacterium culicis]